eukprot:740505-Hanusia_phi.AAC.5
MGAACFGMAGDISALVCVSCTAGASVMVSEFHPKDYGREIQRNTNIARKTANQKNAGQRKKPGRHRDDMFLHQMESTDRPRQRHLLEKQFSHSLNQANFNAQAHHKISKKQENVIEDDPLDNEEAKSERKQENEESSWGPGNFNSLMKRIRRSFVIHDTSDKNEAINQVKSMYNAQEQNNKGPKQYPRARERHDKADDKSEIRSKVGKNGKSEKASKSQMFLHRRASGGWTARVGDANIAQQLDFLRDSKQEWEIKHRIGYDPSTPVHSVERSFK